MGLFGFMKRSNEKTQMMKRMIDVCDLSNINPLDVFNGKSDWNKEKKEATFKEFYAFISNDEYLGPILRAHDVSYEKFHNYMDIMLANGWGWIGTTRFLPVDVFSFQKEMDYFLTSVENGVPFMEIYSNMKRGNY